MRAVMVNPFRYYVDDTMTKDSYTYTGWHEWIDDGDGKWRIKFKNSGVFTPLVDIEIDAFLVGGGAGGGTQSDGEGIVGGGGGYTATHRKIVLESGTKYTIEVGAGGYGNRGVIGGAISGGATSAFSFKVEGGTTQGRGGSGGGRGRDAFGGSDGKDGGGSYNPWGKGQGSTTKEFGESDGTLYAGGGGGTWNASGWGHDPAGGGDGGGGYGVWSWGAGAGIGTDNLGGGGGAARMTQASGRGGCGIVVIRNAR